jgi:hypothetical protein
MLRKRAWSEIIGPRPTTDRVACIDCGEAMAGCLARLGSVRCHDCREHPLARSSVRHAGRLS